MFQWEIWISLRVWKVNKCDNQSGFALKYMQSEVNCEKIVWYSVVLKCVGPFSLKSLWWSGVCDMSAKAAWGNLFAEWLVGKKIQTLSFLERG